MYVQPDLLPSHLKMGTETLNNSIVTLRDYYWTTNLSAAVTAANECSRHEQVLPIHPLGIALSRVKIRYSAQTS